MNRYISPILYIFLMLLGCAAFVAIAGVRVGFLEPVDAFSILRKTVYAAFMLSIMTAVAFVICRKECSEGSQRFFILVGVVSFLYSAMWASLYVQKSRLPDLYDVSTDLETPPVFINISYLRSAADHDLEYDEKWADIQRKAYPEVQPLMLDQGFKQTYIEVLSIVRQRGWDLVAQYPSAGVIEATARTPIFGLRNDVVIRLTRQQSNITRVDMRASSRAGKSDHGFNAHLIAAFMEDLRYDNEFNAPVLMNSRN